MSEYSIMHLTREHTHEMTGMLPEEVLRAIRNELPVTALLAVKDKTVIGALSGVVCGDYFDIYSIHIAQEYRRQGAGTAIMKRLFEVLEKEDLMVRAEYSSKPLYDGDRGADALESFFIALGFSKEEERIAPYISEPLKAFEKGLAEISENEKKSEKIYPFSQVDEEVLKDLCKNENTEGMEDADRGSSWDLLSETVDKNMSFCKVADNVVTAYAVVDTAIGEPVEISAVWLENEDMDDIRIILSNVIEKLNEEYDPETEIVMLAMGPGAKEIIMSVCPGASFPDKSFVRTYYEEI
ncbi:MAG: GNAT family N-acetyltransferase [Lachnospiraceae bacterium]|nr:GNAT family N-acetyltransferase [Lachnospiraceae bacterium]